MFSVLSYTDVMWQVQSVYEWKQPDMEKGDEDLETLGEQLYNRIYPKYKEITGKLTG